MSQIDEKKRDLAFSEISDGLKRHTEFCETLNNVGIDAALAWRKSKNSFPKQDVEKARYNFLSKHSRAQGENWRKYKNDYIRISQKQFEGIINICEQYIDIGEIKSSLESNYRI